MWTKYVYSILMFNVYICKMSYFNGSNSDEKRIILELNWECANDVVSNFSYNLARTNN